MSQENQQILEQPQWRTHLSTEWDVLGPFPIHAREQYFLSPAFPLEVSPHYTHQPEGMWPSSYSTSGSVGWSKALADTDGNLAVSFPEVDWDTLRSTEGWAALQYHSVLRSKLTVYPPGWDPEDSNNELSDDQTVNDVHGGRLKEHSPDDVPFRILATLTRGSQFAILPSQGTSGASSQKPHVPIWHSGNIYELSRAPPNAVELPTIPCECHPTTYDVFVSGDYEIRLFGDPKDSNDVSPTLRLSFNVTPEMKESTVVREASHDIIPDFVNGYAFGNSLSVGLRSVDGWWIVRRVSPGLEFPPELKLSLRHEMIADHVKIRELRSAHRLAPSQTRMVPLVLEQNAPCYANYFSFVLNLVKLSPMEDVKENSPQIDLEVTLNIRQLQQWTADNYDVIRASFLFKNSNPTLFLVKPPVESDEDTGTDAPLLALHGAGVDIFASTFWADAIPRQNSSWIVLPPGRTEWGLDWHGPSAAEGEATISALRNILNRHDIFRAWRIEEDTKVVLIGHSNGGQGVWYMASRYPDRVLAAVPAAGYIKSQAYVPLTQSRSAHYMDPSLRAILESSLTPDDNDLFLSNLVDIPVFAIHGGADTNVPTWHSRQYMASLNDWGANNVSLHIDEGKPHFYPEVFKGTEVLDFIQNVVKEKVEHPSSPFTLTVANPAYSGSMRGWSINSLKIPGRNRIARLHISLKKGTVFVRTENVKRFTIGVGAFGSTMNIEIDSSFNSYGVEPYDRNKNVTFVYMQSSLEWQIAGLLKKHDEEELKEHRIQSGYRSLSLGSLHGRAQDVLDSPDTHMIVVSDHSRALSAAQRIAHVLNVYHKLDAAIFTADEAMALWLSATIDLPPGNFIALGRSQFSDEMVKHHYTPFHLHKRGLKYIYSGHHHTYSDPGTGFILLHPHLTNPESRSIIVSGTDLEGWERAMRLFPHRTGMPTPDFLFVGPAADKRGAAGVLGAGVFNDSWKHNGPMTWQT